RIRWVGCRPRLWRSVISELERPEELTKHNTRMTLYMCINYGGRAEIADAAKALVAEANHGRIKPRDVSEKDFSRYLDEPDMPDVDLFLDRKSTRLNSSHVSISYA